MKKIFVNGLSLILLVLFSNAVSAQKIFVRIKPAAPVVVRIGAPSPNHIWIGDEWIIRNGIYVHQPGYWALPKRGAIWIPGHWSNGRGGYYWVPGHWAKNNRRRF